MKKIIKLSIFILFLIEGFFLENTEAKNQSPHFGLGLILGTPTAITGKWWFSSKKAIDFGLSLSLDNYFLIYGDYLFHYPETFSKLERPVNLLTPYFGFGMVVAVTTKDGATKNRVYIGQKSGTLGLGVRIPIGIEWLPGAPSLGVFLEIVPGIVIIPTTTADVMGGLGVRYYF